MNPYASALAVLPTVWHYLGGAPRVVVDVGCGDGGWLRAATELGAERVLGLDRYQDTELQFAADASHLIVDLNKLLPSDPLGFAPGRLRDLTPFDLAICVETAEHLKPESAVGLVALVTALSDKVLWSAARPGQGPYGAEDDPGSHHNERLPSYWRALFKACGYRYRWTFLSEVRQDPAVDPWYRRTLCLFERVGESS